MPGLNMRAYYIFLGALCPPTSDYIFADHGYIYHSYMKIYITILIFSLCLCLLRCYILNNITLGQLDFF